jgi:hypothetical protein
MSSLAQKIREIQYCYTLMSELNRCALVHWPQRPFNSNFSSSSSYLTAFGPLCVAHHFVNIMVEALHTRRVPFSQNVGENGIRFASNYLDLREAQNSISPLASSKTGKLLTNRALATRCIAARDRVSCSIDAGEAHFLGRGEFAEFEAASVQFIGTRESIAARLPATRSSSENVK